MSGSRIACLKADRTDLRPHGSSVNKQLQLLAASLRQIDAVMTKAGSTDLVKLNF